jgi:hypothetical protein
LLNWRAATMPIDVSPSAATETISAVIPVPEAAGMGSDGEMTTAASFAETLSRPAISCDPPPARA